MTVEQANQAHEAIRNAGNADLAFKSQPDSAIEPQHLNAVEAEIKRIQHVIDKKMGSHPEIEQHLRYELYSEILDTDVVLDDYMAGASWSEFQQKYIIKD